MLVYDDARSRNNRIEYFISACERNPKSCPVDSMRKCIKAIFDLLEVNADLFRAHGFTNVGSAMKKLIGDLYEKFDMASGLCEAAEAGDVNRIVALLFGRENSIFEEFTSYGKLTVNTESTPTKADVNWPFEGYKTLDGVEVGLMNVEAQDFAYGAYDEDTFVNFLIDLNKASKLI